MDLIEHDASIVLVGSLNPAIFHPEWLAKLDLISARDLEGAEVNVVHPEVSLFDLQWARFDVRQDRLIVRSNDPAYFSPLRDLVIGIFSFLEHTPVTAMGINSIIKYVVQDEENWHTVGHTLAPKEIWKNYLSGHIGMTRLSMKSGRSDDLRGSVNVTISPLMDRNGIVFDLNNHIVLESTTEIREILSDHWENLQKDALVISRGLLKDAGAL
ncbi:MAG: hypothetical protein OQL11_00190 [Gammaproteobacteria bacterium]|nr:hypothetical protein [Gammaproteobacteria bacterium]